MKTYPTIRNIQINNSSGYVNIPGNATYSISFNAPGLNNYDYVESAYLYLIIHSYNSDPISKLFITLLGRDEICRSYFDDENNNYILKVDITLLLRFGIHYAEQSLSITNTDSYSITISCDSSYLVINYSTPFDFLNKAKYFEIEISSSFRYRQDYLSFLPYYSKPIFDNGLFFKLSLVYDSYSPDESFLNFFPKGWKINLLEQIIISDSIVLIDENYNRRTFNKISFDQDLYLDESGSGQVLEHLINEKYKLFSPVSRAYKLFDFQGRLEEIHLENGKVISFDYNYEWIKITDYAGNSITINYINDSLFEITSTISSQKYSLIVDSDDNTLSSISFYAEDNTVLTDTIQYRDYGIFKITTFDQFVFTQDYYEELQKIKITKNYTDKTHIDFRRHFSCVEVKDYIKTTDFEYFFDDKHNHLAIMEKQNGNFNAYPNAFQHVTNTLSYYVDEETIASAMQLKAHPISGNPSYLLEKGVSTPSQSRIDLFSIQTSDLGDDASGVYLIVFKLNKDVTFSSNNDNYDGSVVVYERLNEYPYYQEQNIVKKIASIGDEFVALIVSLTDTSSNNPNLMFAVFNNYGTFTISNIFAIKLSNCFRGIYFQSTDSIEPLSFHSNSYVLISEIVVPSVGTMTEKDLTINEIIRIRYGYPKYVFVNNLTSLVYHSSSINNFDIYIEGRHLNFVTEAFLHRTVIKNVETISTISSFSNGYQLSNYRFIDNVEYSSYVKKDFRNNILEQLDYSGLLISNTFDSDYNLIKQTTTGNGSKEINESFTYDQYGRLLSSSKRVGSSTAVNSVQYLSTLNLINSSTDPYNKQTNYQYANYYLYCNNIQKSVSGLSRHVSTSRDNSRLLSTLSDGGNSYGFSYSIFNEINGLSYCSNNLNISFSYSYSQFGDLSATTSIGSSYSFIKKYNKYGKIVEYLQALPSSGFDVTFSYSSQDSTGRLTQINDDSGYQTEITNIEYEDKGRLKAIRHIESGTSSVTYTYDDYGRISQKISSMTGSIYPLFQNKVNVTTNYGYNNATNDVTSCMLSIINYSSFIPTIKTMTQTKTVDSLQRISSLLTVHNNTSIGFTAIEYSSFANNETSWEIRKTTSTLEGDSFYSYNKYGSITSISPNSSPIASLNRTFSYDESNQLIHEKFPDLSETEISYTYDQYGNITSAIKTYKDNSLRSSGLTITVTDTYVYSSTKPNVLISFNSNPLTYDELDNPLTFDGATFTYYRGHKLRTYSKGTTNVTYDYNYTGLRTHKLVGTNRHRYIYENGKLIRESIESTISPYTKEGILYLHGLNGIIGFRYGSDIYLYVKNILNDVVAIYKATSSSLTLVAKYSYDAYGNTKVLNPNGTGNTSSSFIGNINPIRYRSYYYDNETGFYYCKSRYYVPKLRRWLTPDNPSYLDDNSLNGVNLYSYCYNNPIKYVDENGQSISIGALLISIAIGFAIGLATGTATALINDYSDDSSINGSIGISGYVFPMLSNSISGAIYGGIGYFGGLYLGAIIKGTSVLSAGQFFLRFGICLSIGSLESAGTYVVDSIVNNENISSKLFLALFLGSVKALNSFSTGGLSESLELSQSFKNKIIEMFVENIFGAPLDKLLDLLMEKLKWN